ncbi:solute carrier family 35 member C2 isoform X1 [Ictidomys tridecemlineatus]|nr:solute carrier family 35 member C2 isoform X1 [Ictidomys tridecemlineatus]XP_040131053.1 solute carrier family 35 member C2 isoform X1 [Ictidomys tridecemlineatus]XP_040131054.1 solute carrier family 35 member C2 isoform X1 [Ictidomys tridecemlineatus]XP_040131055.1 solute carrier family 35 member C2 isoform X1 [Ictidomys tridecemlineatus]KAG3263511.1 solute carrier family 35 member C2, transcript variant X1 [Ictidomys tridecemlineatus]KAG3263513.1 solute carrier family 35 member C2, transc
MGRWALDVAFVWKAVLTLGLVLLYYCFSIGITFYNKWLTKSFHFPLFMTMLHLAVIFLFSALSRALVQCSSHRARVVLSWTDYLKRVAPTALATALDVGLSNWSFLYITVSLYTMTKSSAVLFILIFSLIFKLEELRATLVLVVLLIAGGLFMFTYKSTQFNVKGFSLVLGASFIGGIRWTLTQMLLQKAELGLQNPIDSMFHLQPLMFLGLFPLFAIFEALRRQPKLDVLHCLHLSTSEKIFRFQDTGLLLRVLGSLFLGGILAFGLGFSEFLLVSRTSSLTLSIAGIFKEVCTLLLAAHLLGDQISLLNWLGFALCLSGISLHVALKTLHSRGEGGSRPLKGLSSSPDLELLLRSSQPEDEDNEEEDYFMAQGQQ